MRHLKQKSTKTVYVLGAGFSRPASIPLQTEILEKVNQLELMDIPSESADILIYDRARWLDFYNEVFKGDVVPTLEDIFTLLDQVIAQRGYCKGYSYDKLDIVRGAFKRAILVLFLTAEENIPSSIFNMYYTLACSMIENLLKGHSISVVTLNWDCLLEKALKWCLAEADLLKIVDIVYGCNILRLKKDTLPLERSNSISRFKYYFKVLKIHGSINYFLCSNCHQLYTITDEHFDVSHYLNPRACPFCNVDYRHLGKESQPKLEPFFITPTFVKAFDNPHINLTWHHAYLELAQADEVIFIGYSLPDADYHFRTLLRRAVKPDAKITVVLRGSDKPGKNMASRMKHFFASTRYNHFYDSRYVQFEFGGIEAFSTNRFGSLEKYIKYIKCLK